MDIETGTLLKKIESFVPSNEQDLEQFKSEYLGKKGIVQQLLDSIKTLPPEQKKEVGKIANQLKEAVLTKYQTYKEKFKYEKQIHKPDDLTRPTAPLMGGYHPITLVMFKIIDVFRQMGFAVAEGPEVEDDWHNFSALNFPPDHPAREMQDTFFINQSKGILLRTHTSSVQIRVMEATRPPLRYIFPGRVYRNEAISARSHCFFHQIEGLYVDHQVSFADLKATLLHFARSIFSPETQIRFRPSFFPFTEPSAEMDISCNLCQGSGCSFCKYTGWVEILGCGMVDPEVLKNCNISPDEFTGFAFGLGVERITNLLFGVNDIRLFSQNDMRFLQNFISGKLVF
ncbi:MAG: phenylalanine--tRNA ligase subunit alpha [Bacteroidales bacterium]|nr:phenylalanine--tRNA ligase subunit alpha [Bacteroidales bacterium]